MSDEYNDEMTEKMSKDDKNAYGDYSNKMQAMDDLRILVQAKEIRADKKRMQRVAHCAKSYSNVV